MKALRSWFWAKMVRVGQGIRSRRMILYAARKAVRADPDRYRDSWIWLFAGGDQP